MTIDIIRRDTLAARHQVGTPLSRLMDTYAAYLDGEPILQGVIVPDKARPHGRSQLSPATPAHPSRPHNPERQRPRSPAPGTCPPRRPP